MPPFQSLLLSERLCSVAQEAAFHSKAALGKKPVGGRELSMTDGFQGHPHHCHHLKMYCQPQNSHGTIDCWIRRLPTELCSPLPAQQISEHLFSSSRCFSESPALSPQPLGPGDEDSCCSLRLVADPALHPACGHKVKQIKSTYLSSFVVCGFS